MKLPIIILCLSLVVLVVDIVNHWWANVAIYCAAFIGSYAFGRWLR